MQKKSIIIAICLITSSGLLAGCGGASPTSSAGDVATSVAATFQALTPQVLITQSAGDPTPLPTSEPAQVYPQGSFTPYEAAQCEQVRSNFEQAIGVSMAVETTSFSDRVTGGLGNACRIHASGNGTTLSMGAFTTLDSFVREQGWIWDGNYGAGGPTGMMEGYRKGSALGLLSVTWQPSSRDLCPSDQPIGACVLTPEQKLFDVTFDIARVVIYIPLPVDQCEVWLTTLQPEIPVSLVQEVVNFNDMEGNTGTACQVRGAGTGLDFSSFMDTANVLEDVFVSQGWTFTNGADGPTGTAREYRSGDQIAIVTVMWKPSSDANCPTDEPIGACNLPQEQRIYKIMVLFARK